MITGAIAFLFVIAMIAAVGNGEWGVVAVCAVIVVLMLMAGSTIREDSKAVNNVVDYWARGGPDRKK